MLAYWQTCCVLQLILSHGLIYLCACALCPLCDFLLLLLNDCRVQLSICWYSPEPPEAPDQLPQQPLLIAGQMSFGIRVWQHTLWKQYTHTVFSDVLYSKNSSKAYFSASTGLIGFFFRTMDSVYCFAVPSPISQPFTWQVLMALL